MNIQWIVAPLVGCVIGYITNWIAIKMLFRPLTPKYIGTWRVPLTPGLIPKEKARLASAVGDAISNNLLDTETVQAALLSDDMKQRLDDSMIQLIESNKDDTRTLRQLAIDLAGEEPIARGVDGVRVFVVDALCEKLIQADLGSLAAGAILDYVKKKSPSALSALVSGILDERVKQNITKQLAEGVNQYVEENAKDVLTGAITGETDKWLDVRICDLIAQHQEKLPEYRQKLIQGYSALIEMGTARVLNAIDIAGIIRHRIADFNERELEALIMSVIKRELNAIVWLGAGLGLIMGCVNLLFL
ncbi:DUF445 family protein [Eubacteriales bacterium OttesenSCG-928-N13]|nr:DUF445 family protein [Eubacteriales bacterium OttesenSCG-928-N13]